MRHQSLLHRFSPCRYAKYFAIARVAVRQRLSERAALVGRILFYGLILLVFSCLWRTVLGAERTPAASPGVPARATGYLWYLVVTEWIMLAQPALHLDIEAEVRSGDVAYQLARPLSYVGAKLAEGAGDLVVRLLILAPAGLAFGRIFSGQWVGAGALALAALAGCVAAGVLLLSYAAIGLCSFWLHDCMSVYLVWQKLAFVLGGLMLPLSIYPEWLQAVARRLPFAALLNGPGQLVLDPNPRRALQLVLELLGWGLLAVVVVVLLERRGRRSIELSGG
jgi:ABC-2 type transport system permease protein